MPGRFAYFSQRGPRGSTYFFVRFVYQSINGWHQIDQNGNAVCAFFPAGKKYRQIIPVCRKNCAEAVLNGLSGQDPADNGLFNLISSKRQNGSAAFRTGTVLCAGNIRAFPLGSLTSGSWSRCSFIFSKYGAHAISTMTVPPSKK